MLRDEKEIALDDALRALSEAVEHYTRSVEIVEDPALKSFFEDLGRQRRADSARLSAQVRRMGYLPAEPDPDRETFTGIGTRLKAALTANDRLLLLNKSLRMEADVIENLENALVLDLPEDIRMALGELANHSRATREVILARRGENS